MPATCCRSIREAALSLRITWNAHTNYICVAAEQFRPRPLTHDDLELLKSSLRCPCEKLIFLLCLSLSSTACASNFIT
jgi:hypothetical protein